MRKNQSAQKDVRTVKLILINVLLFILVVVTVALVVKHESKRHMVLLGQGEEVLMEGPLEGTELLEELEPFALTEKKLVLYTGRETVLKGNRDENAITWSSSDDSVATVSEDGVVIGKKKGTATITAESQGQTVVCDVTVKQTKYVALTFDDGPGEYTPIVLDALEKNNAKATFFLIGRNINSKTEGYVKRASELGCQIGSHTYSHINMVKVSKSRIKQELKKTDALIKKITGSKTTSMRAPYGSINESIMKQINKVQILWNVDTLDWKYKDTDRLVKYVLKNTKDGDIILMHDIHETTANGVERIVEGLYRKGFEMVTVDELAEIKGVELNTNTKYYNFK